MAAHRNTAATIRAVLAACKSQGADPDAVLDASGIARETVKDVDGEVTPADMRNFWQAAYRATGDPQLALRAAREAPLGAYRSFDYMLMNAPTLGDAVIRLVRFFGLINTWLGFKIEESPRSFTLVLSSKIGPVPPPAVEYSFAVLTLRLRGALGEDWAPQEVRFPGPPPQGHELYTAYFGCPVSFSVGRAEYVLTCEAWETPIQGRDSALFHVAEDYSSLLMESRLAPDDLVARVRAEIERALRDGEPRRDVLARKLGLSGRTLHRRLSDAGETFAQLVETVREELAMSYVPRDDLALSEVAFLLGFSDQSAFTRAFKRWTGTTPRQYRLGRPPLSRPV
ncbi:MAG: AraC family transcriptional regulator [Rhodobacteraceae bacterium]|nr:AraC family transcriptional regulator [Paracoccaceae bacterium]